MNNSDYEERLKQKLQEIKSGITKLDEIKELLFKCKSFFYGDFKYSEYIEKVPHPRARIQAAIESLEMAMKEAELIEINSL